MKKISNKTLLDIITFIILIFVQLLRFVTMNLEEFNVLYNYDSINPSFLLYIFVPFLLFIYIKDIFDKKRKLDIFDYIFYALILTGIISTVFSIDKYISIFGKGYRHEGFLSVLSYYLLFINYKVNGDKETIKKFLKLIIIIGIVNAVFSLLQIYTNFSFILRFKMPHMASGLCGNPNFFGSLIVTCLGIMAGKILIDKKNLLKNILITVLLFIALINSQSTGPFIALVCTIVFLVILLFKSKKIVWKNTLILLVTLIITFFAVQSFNNNVFKQPSCELCVEGVKATIDSGFNSRIYIWGNSLNIVKDNFIVGVGYDNFYLAFPNPKVDNSISLSITDISLNKPLETEPIVIIDNAHNVYLHTLISVGIIGLIPYLLLLLITFIKGLKSKNNLVIILLGGFVAYSIQAFGNISVIHVAPIYYLIIGLMLSVKE